MSDSTEGTTKPTTRSVTTSETENSQLVGCNFDIETAKALNGKSIVAMVTNQVGNKMLSVAGQQGLSYNMNAETSEAATKDSSTGGWTLKFHGKKDWDASIDGLYSPDDEAAGVVAKALMNDEYLCLKICERIPQEDGSVKYVPLRMGLAIVTSDNFEAPHDDNATYSMDFAGSGKPWLREAATAEEVAKATFTIPAAE